MRARLRLAGRPLDLEAPRWCTVAGVLPGVVVAMLHSAATDLPRADLIDALHSDVYRIQWATGGYMIGAAAGMAMTRFWGERLGLRRAYLAALLLFGICAGLAGTFDDVLQTTPLRLAAGYGMGLLISTGMAMIWRDFSADTELAMALYGIGAYLSALLGVSLGGFLVANASWRWLFFVNTPLALGAFALARRVLPLDAPPPQPERLDRVGFLLFVLAVLCATVLLDMGQYWGWFTSPFFVPWFAAFTLLFGGFIAWGLLAPAPLIDLRAFRQRNFGVGLTIKALFSSNLYVLLALLSAYMIGARGYQWWQGALIVLPALLAMGGAMLAGARWGSTSNRRGRILIGLLVMAGLTWAIAGIDLYTPKLRLAAALALWGIGAGLAIGPIMLTVFEGMPRASLLRATGLFNIMRALPAFVVGSLLLVAWTRHTDGQFDRLRLQITRERPAVARTAQLIAARLDAHGTPRSLQHAVAFAELGRWVHANASVFALQWVLRALALITLAAAVLVLALSPNAAGQAASPR